MKNDYKARGLASLLLLAASPLVLGDEGATDVLPVNNERGDVVERFVGFGRGLTPFDVAVAGDGRIVVVGRGGLMAVLAADGRQIVGRINSAGKRNLLSVALGPDGLLRVTDGDGTIWRIDATLTEAHPEGKGDDGGLFSIQFMGDGTGVAVGESGSVLLKYPDSPNWRPLLIDWSERLPELALEVGDLAPHLYRVCARPEGGFLAVGEFGVTLTYRGGEVEVKRAAQDAGNVFACYSGTDGRDIIAGRSGTFFSRGSVDDAWLEMRATNAKDIYDIVYLEDGFLAVGQGGDIIRSQDGSHWSGDSGAWVPATEWVVRAVPVGHGLVVFGKDGYFFIKNLAQKSGAELS